MDAEFAINIYGTPMEKNPLRISRLLTSLAAASIVVGCASAPQQPVASEPPPEPVVAAPAAPAPEPAPAAAPLVLKPDHPQRYVVAKGDTLWGISSRFLSDPWRWPELWDRNTTINNPHLIYPGDVLVLSYRGGQPVIEVQRGGVVSRPAPGGMPEVRLSPKVRVEGLDRPIHTIPISAIRPFLTRPRVVTQHELDAAPYIVSSVDKHLIASPGHRVYVRGLTDADLVDYMVVRAGDVYRNPDNKEDILGYEAIHVGDVQLKAFNSATTTVEVGSTSHENAEYVDEFLGHEAIQAAEGEQQELASISTLEITASTREILNGDRLLPVVDSMPDTSFMPRAPKDKVQGQIIAVPGGVSLIGQYQVVALNLGKSEGMEPGHVLAVYQRGEMVRDRMRGNELVRMPDEHAGTLMVFRTFERVSYGLVLQATRTMHVNDLVTNP
jgi:hypothetical protein